MSDFTFKELFHEEDFLPQQLLSVPFKGFCHHTDFLQAGEVFLAFQGGSIHGISLIEQVVKKQARALVFDPQILEEKKYDQFFSFASEHSLPLIPICPWLLLEKTARKIRSLIQYPLIAVTGTAGKTTLKNFAKQFFCSEKVFTSRYNWNNKLGVLLNLCSLKPTYQGAFFECGISRPGEMQVLSDLIQPTDLLITSLAESHLETMGCIENVVREKLVLADHVQEIFLFYSSAKKIPQQVLEQLLAKEQLLSIHLLSPHALKGVENYDQSFTKNSSQYSGHDSKVAKQFSQGSKSQKSYLRSFLNKELEHCYKTKIKFQNIEFDRQKIIVSGEVFERRVESMCFDESFALVLKIGQKYGFKRRHDLPLVMMQEQKGRGLLTSFSQNIDLMDHTYNCTPQSLRLIIKKLLLTQRPSKILIGGILEQPHGVLEDFAHELLDLVTDSNIEVLVTEQLSKIWPKSLLVIKNPKDLKSYLSQWQKTLEQKDQEKSAVFALTASAGYKMHEWLDYLLLDKEKTERCW